MEIKYSLIFIICFISAYLTHKYPATKTGTVNSQTAIHQTYTGIPETPEKFSDSKNGCIMTALVIGQSNAANYGESLYRSKYKVYTYHKGKLYPAADPMPGASGIGGSVWAMLGDTLIENNYYDKVIFTITAIGSTSIKCWSDGECSIVLDAALNDLRKNNIKLTHIFWHQGEEDNYMNTPRHIYKAELKKILNHLRNRGQNAPLFISLASFTPWSPDKTDGMDNEIRKAQREFVYENKDVYIGPDTDTITSASDRFDGIHFSESGMKKYSTLWFNAIIQPGK